VIGKPHLDRSRFALVGAGGWTITGDPNGEITFSDPDGNPRGTSTPRHPPPLIATRTGNEITQARERSQRLREQLGEPCAA
jgi:hypothetical protein